MYLVLTHLDFYYRCLELQNPHMLYLLKYYSSASQGNLFEDVTSCQPSSAEEDLEDGDCTGGIYGTCINGYQAKKINVSKITMMVTNIMRWKQPKSFNIQFVT